MGETSLSVPVLHLRLWCCARKAHEPAQCQRSVPIILLQHISTWIRDTSKGYSSLFISFNDCFGSVFMDLSSLF